MLTAWNTGLGGLAIKMKHNDIRIQFDDVRRNFVSAIIHLPIFVRKTDLVEPKDSTSSESEFFLVMSRILSKLSSFCANPETKE